ncbi:hypothetical protein HHI36_019945 [Cryptolaemus montrouzieri]|uniref:Uncharacterized protein n=1 Tax=Cryptolaemus montrouzieri TaxID=559131 RepID=A0ABD2N8T5_9CUCU
MENQFHKFHDSEQVFSSKMQRYLNSRREENLVNLTAEVELTVKNFLNNNVETRDLMKPLIRKEHHSTKVNIGLTKEGGFNDKDIKSIQKKLKEEKLITKTDKGKLCSDCQEKSIQPENFRIFK